MSTGDAVLGKRKAKITVERRVKRAPKPGAAAKSTDAMLIAKMKKQIQKDTEKKGCDFALEKPVASPTFGFGMTGPITSNLSNNGFMAVVNLLQVGAAAWNRVGRKVTLQSIRLRGNFQWDYTLDDTVSPGQFPSNIVRMFVVWDKQPNNQVVPSFSDIFGRTNQGGFTSTDLQDPVRYGEMERFSVLRDEIIHFHPDMNPIYTSGGTTHNPPAFKVVPFDVFVDLKGREAVYSTSSSPATSADLATGSVLIGFKALREGTASPTDQNDVSIGTSSFARLRYTDA